MSLLNQVLQDLEKRNAEQPANLQNTDLLDQLKPAKPAPKKNATLIILISILVLASIYVSYRFISKQPAPLASQTNTQIKPIVVATPSAQKHVATKTTTSKPEEKPQEIPVIAIKPTPAITPTKIAAPKPKTQKTNRITTVIKSKPSTAAIYFTRAKKSQDLSTQQSLLEKTLQLDSKHFPAHLLLANNWLQQGATDRAIFSLQKSLTQLPRNIALTNILAQLYLQTQQTTNALNTLLSINPATTQDETFLSLLAASYQQANDAQNSSTIYQKLLIINPQKAEYWLGLAMAYEKLNQATHAVTAYQQALNKKSLKPSIVSYINQRISQLN